MFDKLKNFKTTHSDIYEFIMFNLLSNIATITNFVVINFSKSILFSSLKDVDFRLWIFDYSVANGGLAGFLAFLLSYAAAQTVNFIVQRKLVFGANNKLNGKVIGIYIFTILFVYFICLYVPTLLMQPLTKLFGSMWATNLSNIVNIIIQVIINYPVMKFIIMKKEK